MFLSLSLSFFSLLLSLLFSNSHSSIFFSVAHSSICPSIYYLSISLSVIFLLIQTLGADNLKDEEAEARNRVWKQVQNERKKYVTFSCPKGYGKDNLIAALKASGKVYTFSGQLNSNHRLFCGSADLLQEGGDEPWMNSTEPKADSWKGICDFMGSLTGSTDFCILFDGRMRSIRRISVPRFSTAIF